MAIKKKKKVVAKKKATKKKKTVAKKKTTKKKLTLAKKLAKKLSKEKAKKKAKARAKAQLEAKKARIIEVARRKALRTTRYFFAHEIGDPDSRWAKAPLGSKYVIVGEPTKVRQIKGVELPTIIRQETRRIIERDYEPEPEPDTGYDYDARQGWIEPEPEPTPAPVIELPPEIPFYYVETGAASMYTEPGMNDEEHYQYASSLNRAALDRMTIDGTSRVETIFEHAFIGALNKGPFEADEIHIYRHGIIIRPREGEFTERIKNHITELLADYPGSSVHVVNEPSSDGTKGTFSLRINVGSSTESSSFMNVGENMDYHKDVFQAIYSYIQDEYDTDVDWSAFWDTEESMYE